MTAPVVTASNLSRHYETGGGLFSTAAVVRALSDASFSIQPGKTLAVVGESGCGKSTLARLVTLIEEPTGGDLTIGGTNAVPENWDSLRTAGADRVPGPLRLAEPAPPGRRRSSRSRSRSTAPTCPPQSG